jgi:hypothetical protein
MSNSILYVETKIFTASAEGVKAIETSIGSGDVLIANPNKEPRAQSLRESSSVSSEALSESDAVTVLRPVLLEIYHISRYWPL